MKSGKAVHSVDNPGIEVSINDGCMVIDYAIQQDLGKRVPEK